mmetsp:Transcript_31445/g.108137  ORF Transcript_31445/g.108137 Transcript_31445/m.108137 type:complete len:268 (+) Transcript_31445:44-847(+)
MLRGGMRVLPTVSRCAGTGRNYRGVSSGPSFSPFGALFCGPASFRLAAALFLVRLVWREDDVAAAALGDGAGLDLPPVDSPGEVLERLHHVGVVLRRSLVVRLLILCGERGGVGLGDLAPLLLDVALAPADGHVDVAALVFVNVVDPRSHVAEGDCVGDVVADHEAVGFPEKVGRQRPEALLARRVPDLQLDLLAVDFQELVAVVDADGGHELCAKRVLIVPHHQRSLAHVRVADHEDADHLRPRRAHPAEEPRPRREDRKGFSLST